MVPSLGPPLLLGGVGEDGAVGHPDVVPDEAQELGALDELLDDVADVEEGLDLVVGGGVVRRPLLQEGNQVARQPEDLEKGSFRYDVCGNNFGRSPSPPSYQSTRIPESPFSDVVLCKRY